MGDVITFCNGIIYYGTPCTFTFMGLNLEWNKGPRDFSKFASCNLKGNNFNKNILPYA